MRIGWLIYGDLDTPTGGFFYDKHVIRRLRDRGYIVDVVSLPWRSTFFALWGSLWGWDWRGLASRPWDVVVEDGLVMPSLSLRAPHWPFPRVVLMHNPRTFTTKRPWSRLMARLESRYLSRVEGLLAVCRFNVQWARAHGFQGPAAVAYPAGDHLHPTISRDAVRERARHVPPLRIVFVGQVIPHKGLHVLLKALAQLPLDRWQLTVIGETRWDPSYVRRLKDFLARHDMSQRVHWTGRLSHAGVAFHLERAHVLAVPSRSEGYPLAYVEAMGFGLPVIGTRVGGPPELIREGENGFLVAPENPEDVLRAITQCFHRDRLTRMALAARDTFEAHPRWDDAADIIADFLVQQVQKGGHTPSARRRMALV